LFELVIHAPLGSSGNGLIVDEKTNVQLRPRLAPTLAPQPGLPIRLEHEYKSGRALHMFAAFDTRTGKVYARAARRKRQKKFIPFLAQLQREIPSSVTRIYLIHANARIHKGKRVQTWLATHSGFTCH
jgi:hypothetical protein